MPNLNKVLLIGNAGDDARLGDIEGRSVANFSLATHRRYKSGEEWKTKTSWHQVAIFGPLAGSVAKHVTKGRQVLVEGYLDNATMTVGDQKIQTSRVVGESFQVDPPRAAGASSSNEDT